MKRFGFLAIVMSIAVLSSLLFEAGGFAWPGDPPPPPPWEITTTYNGTVSVTATLALVGKAEQLSHPYVVAVERNSDAHLLQTGSGTSSGSFPSNWNKDLAPPSGGWEATACTIGLYVDNFAKDSTPVTFSSGS